MAVALERRRGKIRDWFSNEVEERSIHCGGRYESRFKMTARRFELLASCFRLRIDPAGADEGDKWYMIRKFINSFNRLRKEVVTPGQFLTADVCMSAFRSESGEYRAEGIPHLTKIARKPEGVGLELKSLADSDSGIILHVEIQEGKDSMREKDMSLELGAGAACLYMMTEHYHGTKRTVVADSWFGSFTAASALIKVGLYSMLIVKTAHRFYPLAYLKQWAADEEMRVDEAGNRIP